METVQGEIISVVFKSEDNGYAIAKIKSDESVITITGFLPYIDEGQVIKAQGEWTLHKTFGNQLKIESYEEIIPSSKEAVEKYLSSGIITGIGPITAKKILEKFGENALDVIESSPERLSEIDGLGKKRIELIKESFFSQIYIKNIMIFLQSYGITPNQCMKIYQHYKEGSIETVKNNPYVLTEDISGIGFKTADKIAKSLGIDMNSPYRVKCGIKYIINKFSSLGNTYMPYDLLINQCKEILLVGNDSIERGIYEAVFDTTIKIEDYEGTKCVYSIPFYYCEVGVTRKIVEMATNQLRDLDIDIEKEVKDFEHKNHISFSQSQKDAIFSSFKNSIEIITGGPGTGKTTIINCILHTFEKHKYKVFMAAPTGRAAKRMSIAAGREAKTIHRMLEIISIDDDISSFEKNDYLFENKEKKLECDVLIVDEVSMIDIVLMYSLLKSLDHSTRLILVGDVDQLPSVGPGNVLSDLIDSDILKVVRLNEIFRQSEYSYIVLNAHNINNGKMPIMNEKNSDFYFINSFNPNSLSDEVVNLVSNRLPKFNHNWDMVKDIQVLSPMRKGIIGTSSLNEELQKILNPKDPAKKEKEYRNTIFRAGDKVMQIKNNYMIEWQRISNDGEDTGTGIFNGDIGYIEDIDDEAKALVIIFDEDKRVLYEYIYLDELELAYAITVHKSQGSEFPVVVVPIYIFAPMLMTRNLLYTAITRAKEFVVLIGTVKALNFMIKNTKIFERCSLLKWRIREITRGE
ncbi:MAG: ATP-dependent RecD-like DNA helicase [Oscillospiraceae bacterium]|nr:ATP-dependent RecD-like DNA helicase [Oscillospiraceae bacterium]